MLWVVECCPCSVCKLKVESIPWELVTPEGSTKSLHNQQLYSRYNLSLHVSFLFQNNRLLMSSGPYWKKVNSICALGLCGCVSRVLQITLHRMSHTVKLLLPVRKPMVAFNKTVLSALNIHCSSITLCLTEKLNVAKGSWEIKISFKVLK